MSDTDEMKAEGQAAPSGRAQMLKEHIEYFEPYVDDTKEAVELALNCVYAIDRETEKQVDLAASQGITGQNVGALYPQPMPMRIGEGDAPVVKRVNNGCMTIEWAGFTYFIGLKGELSALANRVNDQWTQIEPEKDGTVRLW